MRCKLSGPGYKFQLHERAKKAASFYQSLEPFADFRQFDGINDMVMNSSPFEVIQSDFLYYVISPVPNFILFEEKLAKAKCRLLIYDSEEI